MKKRFCSLAAWSLTAALSAIAAPLSTELSYRGSLVDGGQPADGLYDLSFALFNLEEGGVPVVPVLTKANLVVSLGVSKGFTRRSKARMQRSAPS